MTTEVDSSSKRTSRLLVVLLCGLVVVIVGLVIGIVLNANKRNSALENELIDSDNAMQGWDGPVSDYTKASMLAENIRSKLENGEGYSVQDAIMEYSDIYAEAEGELKAYIAIEYANFVYYTANDFERAIEIMRSAEGLVDGGLLENVYFSAMRDLYENVGDVERAEYYGAIINESVPTDVEININRSE